MPRESREESITSAEAGPARRASAHRAWTGALSPLAVVEGEEQKMFLWILAIAVVVALTGAGVMFLGRLYSSRARGRCLSGLGV